MNMKSKTFAFITTSLMIISVFVCCSFISENSSAVDFGSPSSPLTSLYEDVWIERDVTYYVAVGSPVYLYSVYDDGGFDEFFYEIDGVTGGFGLSFYEWDGSNSYVVSGTITKAGTISVPVTWVNGRDGHNTITIVAVSANHTITFNTMGGSYIAPQSVSPGSYATAPANPTNGVKVFGGWFTDQECTQAFNFSTPINSNITLYAKWTDPTASVTSSHGNSTMTVGQLFTYDVSTNPNNATVSVSGADWLNVSGHSIYGTPTSPGAYNVTITSSASGYNSGSQSFTITVSSVLAPGNTPSNGVIAYVR